MQNNNYNQNPGKIYYADAAEAKRDIMAAFKWCTMAGRQ